MHACMHACMPARVRTFLQRLRGQDVPEAARVLAHEERHEARGEPADRVEVREAQVCRARGQRGPREGADLFYYLFFIFIFIFLNGVARVGVVVSGPVGIGGGGLIGL